jgi:hypothetical protein
MLTPQITNTRQPNCGIVAIAALTHRTVEEATALYLGRFPRAPSWKGRTHLEQLLAVLKADGYHTVREARGGRLSSWVPRNTIPNRHYLLRLGGHFVSVLNDAVIDQDGSTHVSKSNCRNKLVTHAYGIIKKGD